MLWKLAKWVLGFIGGVVLVTLAGLLIDALGLLGADHPMELAKRWCIGGDSEMELTIRLPAPRPVSIKVSRPGSWFGFESLRLCEEGGIEFCLEQQGRYGPPEARYSGGSEEKRFTWIDLNNDGWFDVLYRTPENSWYIRDNDSWLSAVIEGSVARTERGVLEFNAQTGRWNFGNFGGHEISGDTVPIFHNSLRHKDLQDVAGRRELHRRMPQPALDGAIFSLRTPHSAIRNEARLYYTTDANQNVTALVESDGDVVERYVYDPYGQVTFYQANWQKTQIGNETPGTLSAYSNAILFGGRIVRSVRRVVLHLASAFPLQDLFRAVLARLTERRCLPTAVP